MNLATVPQANPATPWFATTPENLEPTPPAADLLDSRAFGSAFEQNFHRTVRFLAARGVALDVAEEVAQAAWARAWEHRQQLHHRHLLCPWINSIAKNLLKNRVRAERRFEPLAEGALYARQDAGALYLQQLLRMCGDPTSAALMRDHYIRGYTAEELGRRLGLSPSAIRVRLFRVRGNLRSLLRPPE
jgi:RNA polymerase sigma factor (sigma-70 family)